MRRQITRLSACLTIGLPLALAAIAVPQTAHAQYPLSVRSNFRIGTSGVLCSAQVASSDARLKDLFDRAYRLTCRDAAGAIGSVIAVRRDISLTDPAMGMGGASLSCRAPASVDVKGLGAVNSALCHDPARKIDYRRYLIKKGNTAYLAEGLAGYDPAIQLALASVVNDRIQPGEVSVASTEVSDAAAFARVQAGTLDAQEARAEAYFRNNDGRFAEAADFFEVLAARTDNDAHKAELIANAGLQQSNLGNFASAYSLFLRAESATAQSDGITQRLLRNYRAINLLNQRFADAAILVLDTPVLAVERDFDVSDARRGVLSEPLANQINRENTDLKRLGGIETGLTPLEHAAILDAQAVELRAAALSQQGKLEEAAPLLKKADAALLAVRDGRVASANWIRAQIAIELANIAEALDRKDEAAGAFAQAVSLLETYYPASPILLAGRARQAAYFARAGEVEKARALFAAIVDESEKVQDSSAALRDLLSPYFGLLAEAGDAAAPAQFFRASQLLQRPGVASTQATLARELSEGDDEASALFRLSLSRTREIVRTEAELATLTASPTQTPEIQERLAGLKQTMDALRSDQTALLAKLGSFSRYKVLASTYATLDELQGALKDGEAYFKTSIVGDAVYAMYVDRQGSRIFKSPRTVGELEQSVSQIRDSIVRMENGQVTTYPFDIEESRALFVALMGPVAERLKSVRHLVFEPDGPLLQLPPSVLVTDDKSVERYKARIARPNADEFDFTGTAWLGRNRRTTIAVSPRAFLDVRAIAPSRAAKTYLGLGSNAVPAQFPAGQGTDGCDWPLLTWKNPIDPAELKLARSIIGAGKADVLTSSQFSDSALLGSDQLSKYRILHFATHGLVTAPKPQCPAQPALVTSFGAAGSDGLLSFKEVFDLRLDADLVILSACDTAGMASASVSRAAGIRTGGNYALDGLVRAFVGAGARSVIASHWPVPDDYGATKKLISGLFAGKKGQSVGQLLSKAQLGLMDGTETSHPFYWAAFVILGDGDKAMFSH